MQITDTSGNTIFGSSIVTATTEAKITKTGSLPCWAREEGLVTLPMTQYTHTTHTAGLQGSLVVIGCLP